MLKGNYWADYRGWILFRFSKLGEVIYHSFNSSSWRRWVFRWVKSWNRLVNSWNPSPSPPTLPFTLQFCLRSHIYMYLTSDGPEDKSTVNQNWLFLVTVLTNTFVSIVICDKRNRAHMREKRFVLNRLPCHTHTIINSSPSLSQRWFPMLLLIVLFYPLPGIWRWF